MFPNSESDVEADDLSVSELEESDLELLSQEALDLCFGD